MMMIVVVQKGQAEGAAPPAPDRVQEFDARAQRVRRQGDGQEVAHRELVDRELQNQQYRLKVA